MLCSAAKNIATPWYFEHLVWEKAISAHEQDLQKKIQDREESELENSQKAD